MHLLHNEYIGELKLGASTTIAQYVLCLLYTSDIAMYTDTEDVPLKEVFLSMKKKENGAAVVLDLKKATADDLRCV